VDPVPDPLLLKKNGSGWNRTRTSGSVARNSGHYTTAKYNGVTAAALFMYSIKHMMMVI
jgi:hypothetical protein